MATGLNKMSMKQLDALMTKIETQKGARRRAKIRNARAAIGEILKKDSLKIGDVYPGRTAQASTAHTGKSASVAVTPAPKKKGASKGKVPAKFRNPSNATETWSGRGSRPLWFVAAIDSGATPESMLIKSPAAKKATKAAGKKAPSSKRAGKAVKKGAGKKAAKKTTAKPAKNAAKKQAAKKVAAKKVAKPAAKKTPAKKAATKTASKKNGASKGARKSAAKPKAASTAEAASSQLASPAQ